jgi:hypothetical protein
MKKIFFYAWLVLICASCSTTTADSADQIVLFNNISFSLTPDETVQEISDSLKTDYLATFDNKIATIPLFRSVQHTDYQLYIGLPFQASFEKLQNIHSIHSLKENKTDGNSYVYQQYQTNETYITTLVRKEKQGTIYIVTSTSDETIAKNTFTYEKLNQRILIKE